DWTPRSEAYFVFPLAQGTPGKQCGLAATGVYQPSLRSPWLSAYAYYGVSGNSRSISNFAYQVELILFKWLGRRGKRGSLNFE
ncbi:hypothetical protein, partial [Thiolapillus sp.]|uniref:hypothetical protein n=1 Tax=Thiolapillus sp. TaxID=2017437 RepID=UPI003AF925F9